ncbi:DUF6053 domain-containing protein [Lysobacter enzymogenes]
MGGPSGPMLLFQVAAAA